MTSRAKAKKIESTPEYEKAQELYLNGAADAAMGYSPASKIPEYLDGYLGKLRELILTSPYTLRINWLSPAYLSGGYDSPEEF
jgi:hypothetical protein